ncbi:hypothetical protein HBJ58_10950 [Halomonas desiderata]|uniref:hypothetical protein n=1 Tax=Billgrantia desiderata TaxID=52021 RepID=UPI00174AB081|nr:hypothetical protein [Halomonas desiderata]
MKDTKTRRERNPASCHRSGGLTAHQAAVITIGRLLVAYRVNRRSEQRAELLGMARMAAALGALDAATHAFLLDLVAADCRPSGPEVH